MILVGVSRTGKTPLSVVLAQQFGLKVANIPLVLEVPPPKELFDPCIDSDKVMCLTINPVELKRIRLNRLERSGAKQLEETGGERLKTQEWMDYVFRRITLLLQLIPRSRSTLQG